MKKKRIIILYATLVTGIALVASCTKEVNSSENEIMPEKGNMMLKSASILPDCESLCITPGSEVYYKRTESNIVSWGGKSGTANSKDVEIEYYNTETEFVLKVKSSSGWTDLIIDGVSKWTGDPVAPNDWEIFRVPLSEGWKPCDQVNYELTVTGNGPQALFTVSYSLIGICSHCREQFSYEKNFDGTYTFSYTPSEDFSDANVSFTFAQADQVTVSGLLGWDKVGETRQKTMNLLKCHTYEWIIDINSEWSGHSGNSNLWTDFKVNNVSKKNISEPTPNITSD